MRIFPPFSIGTLLNDSRRLPAGTFVGDGPHANISISHENRRHRLPELTGTYRRPVYMVLLQSGKGHAFDELAERRSSRSVRRQRRSSIRVYGDVSSDSGRRTMG